MVVFLSLAITFGLTLLSLIPIGIASWMCSRHLGHSLQDFGGAVKGFAIFNMGLVTLFWALWSMAGGGNMSTHSYGSGSVLLLIAASIIAVAMHMLLLPKVLASAFFVVPMISMPFKYPGADFISTQLPFVLPLFIVGYWVWREGHDRSIGKHKRA